MLELEQMAVGKRMVNIYHLIGQKLDTLATLRKHPRTGDNLTWLI
jgi:hypothetical protein